LLPRANLALVAKLGLGVISGVPSVSPKKKIMLLFAVENGCRYITLLVEKNYLPDFIPNDALSNCHCCSQFGIFLFQIMLHLSCPDEGKVHALFLLH